MTAADLLRAGYEGGKRARAAGRAYDPDELPALQVLRGL